MKSDNKTVFVGVSGGVDSSVSAALLKEQGYNVVGVFIRTWQPDFIECTWRDERRDAMRVCAHLDIPFLECDAEEVYKKNVADYMIEEYKKGNTPNPDVMCNREVKFGIFWEFAKEHGADYIATGHYAINKKNLLYKSNDKTKDQSYFLWTLTAEDLSHTLFPIGHLQKTEVRKLAKKYKLPTAIKKDSQGVCFLGPLDMKDFLMHYIESKQGDVLDKDGKVIGSHDGAVFFTLGERHGFIINKHSTDDAPVYVINKDIKKNTITVSPSINSLENIDREKFKIKNVNWIFEPILDKEYTAQVRYHGDLLLCKIKIENISEASVIFKNPTIVSPGQSIVVYDNDICLGGGVVV
ncbi:MAG: tRNA 2-thiouridine(34) synthase MnmA [Patescibacteria group bacterium]|nr:tRNA 2-thiouridine(34) synthase MnmA [Patescibacteria group bacterium]